jgi:DNA-binding protein HU-beta
MNKAELVSAIAERMGAPKKHAEEMLESFVDVIIDTLKAGDEVTLTGFGTFSSKVRKARVGVNPQNPSVKINIPATTVAKFKPGTRLKKALKG